jgi:hypothetical protein
MGTQESENIVLYGSRGNVRILFPSGINRSNMASRMASWFHGNDGTRAVSGNRQEVMKEITVEPHEHLELEIPDNVHEIILIEDGWLGTIRRGALRNATSLCFLALLFFVMLIAEFVSHVLWG